MAKEALKRKRNAEATRGELLDAATEVFAETGYHGARVDDIATRARVNKRMIYAYFGDKEGLYRSVLASYFERISELASANEAAESDPWAATEAVIREYFEVLAEHPRFARLLVWELLSGVGHFLIESATPGLGALRGILRSGVSRGVFRSDLDDRKTVMSVNALCLGFFLQRATLGAVWRRDLTTPQALEEIVDHTLRFVSDGISRRKS